nr:reverse transcriptase domain-containing protein [Tanacetum cinerariifolium]
EVKLKDLLHHLEYAFLEGDNKFPVIIAKELRSEEKAALIKVLKSHKRAIAWKLSDIQGINQKFCTHKILIEEDYKPAVQHQRRVNPKIHDVIKKEVEKLLDAGLIYPISDSPWVSPIHCIPKKGGFTVVENEENKLIPTRLVTGWRVCIDYRKLNEATQKDHFPLPFMDQMLERLAGNEYYCFLDGFSGTMDTTIEQQLAMNEALVPTAQRLKIERSNFRLLSDIKSKELTLQLVYDVLQEILAIIRFLGHSVAIRTLTDVNINKLYQSWRSFDALINKCLTGKSSGYDSFRLSQAQILWGLYHKKNVDYAYLMWEDFVYQVEHKNQKKSNEMYYP